MKKVLDTLKKFFSDKKNIIICACVLVIIILLIAIISAANNQERKFQKELKSYAKVYYEDVYYNLISEDNRVEFLSSYGTLGIKADLENLLRAIDGIEPSSKVPSSVLDAQNKILASKITDRLVNKKTNKACSSANTKITIYPTDPYGKTDYKVEVKLDCGFEN